ncbi:DNA replication complex GINS protein PSF3 [Coccinella septempunctata]|uniref:DNA replication complex GINS protein PSF3 n=1 Tax=Coccinella septempunctata TaxID=41139 RepID=UPI001D063F05|nr:DNA replication complex GINS protein PSF3 [Coccinella septempunctata]
MNFKPSYFPNYFEIDDILATQERVPCKFTTNVLKLGNLNPSSEEKDLKMGTALELPLWFVQDISGGRQSVVAPELPKYYKEGYRQILKADASAVDLHKFNLYFYELGAYVKNFDRRKDVSDTLLNTFTDRFRQLMDLSDNTEHNPAAVQRLDTLERRLFKDACESKAKLYAWLEHSVAPIETASMVLNHKKRKRVNVEDIL